jgi:hypothetical protein
MRFHLLNFPAQAIFNHNAAMKKTPSLLWEISMYENVLFILHYKYPNNLYLSTISWHELICEIKSRFKIVYFFLTHPVVAFPHCSWLAINYL